MAGTVRFLRNVNLKVSYCGEDGMVPFGAGDTYKVDKIHSDPEGYSDIFMPDGSVLRGVLSKIFELHGKVAVIEVDAVAPVEENHDIKVEESTVKPIVLDGTMLSRE